jgi:hypothetical protein
MDEKVVRLLALVRGKAHEIATADRYEDSDVTAEGEVRDYIETCAEDIERAVNEYLGETKGTK